MAFKAFNKGCQNRREQRRTETVLRPHSLFWPTQVDCVRAFDDYAAYHLSHNIGILDALIAEIAVGLGMELVTFNHKHYRVVSALHTLQPYTRR